MEEPRISPPGDNFTLWRQSSLLGDNFAPRGLSLPLGVKLRNGLWINVCTFQWCLTVSHLAFVKRIYFFVLFHNFVLLSGYVCRHACMKYVDERTFCQHEMIISHHVSDKVLTCQSRVCKIWVISVETYPARVNRGQCYICMIIILCNFIHFWAIFFKAMLWSFLHIAAFLQFAIFSYNMLKVITSTPRFTYVSKSKVPVLPTCSIQDSIEGTWIEWLGS
jgi:hypothetical protein